MQKRKSVAGWTICGLALLSFVMSLSASAQTPTPDCTADPYNVPAGLPTATTTTLQDLLHMMCLQGLKFPTSTSTPAVPDARTSDVNRPKNAWPGNLTTPETSNWTDALRHTIVRWRWGMWTTYDDSDSGGNANVLCNGAPGCTVAGQQGSSTGGSYIGGGDYGPAGTRPYPTGSALLGPGNAVPCTSPGCLASGTYPAIDNLTMMNGTKITTAKDWWTKRRPEILDLMQKELYGYMWPASKWPSISWSIGPVTTGTQTGTISCVTGPGCANGTVTNGVTYNYRQKTYTGTISTAGYPASAPPLRNAPIITMQCRLPADATKKVPVIIALGSSAAFQYTAPYGVGVCGYTPTQVQADSGGANLSSYLIGLINGGDWRQPSDPGALEAWSWGISRAIDYFALDPDPIGPDADKVGLEGHSRYGKATLVAAALDDRIVAALPSSAGALGTAPIRRHYGESIESVTGTSEYHWVAGTLINYAGPACQRNPDVGPAGCTPSFFPRKVGQLDVDSPQVMALIAPRAVMTNGGTAAANPGNGDEWQDPRGMYLAGALSGPVWELLGWPGQIIPAGTVFTSNPTPYTSGESIGGTPPFDTDFIAGTVGYRRHVQGHTDVPTWPVFAKFAAKYLNDARPVITPGQSFVLPAANSSVGTVVGTAGGGGVLKSWQIKGGTGAEIFAINSTTGAVTIPDRTKITSNTALTLTLMASDGILPSHDETVTIGPATGPASADPTSTALALAAATTVQDMTQTLTATVTDLRTPTTRPTGTVTFTDFSGTTISSIGTSAVTNGVATIDYRPTVIGNHTITASYASSDNTRFVSSADAAGKQMRVVADFQFAPQGSAGFLVNAKAGQSVTVTFNIAPYSGTVYPAAVSFSASGLPSGATATFNPASIAADAGATTVTMTVNLPTNLASNQERRPGNSAPLIALGLLAFGSILAPKRARYIRPLLVILFMAGAAFSMSGCSNSYSSKSYTANVTATSGVASKSTGITFVVDK